MEGFNKVRKIRTVIIFETLIKARDVRSEDLFSFRSGEATVW